MTEQAPRPELDEEQQIEQWLAVGRANPWIQEAWDPPFDRRSFAKCETPDELAERLAHGNWSLGSAFYHKDLCLINQVDGGDEWLTIRHGFAFESVSFGLIDEHEGRQATLDLINRLLVATAEQCRGLEY